MYKHHKCIIWGTEIQRMWYKCYGIAEKSNKEWLGNLVININSIRKQIPLLYWGHHCYNSGTMLVLASQNYSQYIFMRDTLTMMLWNRREAFCLSPVPPSVSTLFLPSVELSQKPLDLKASLRNPLACWTQLPWDPERIEGGQRMAQMVRVLELVPMACYLIHWYLVEMSVDPCLFPLGPGVLQFSLSSLISLLWPFKGPLKPDRDQKRDFSLSTGSAFSLMLLPSYSMDFLESISFLPIFFFWEKIIYSLDECREWEFS